MSDNRNKKDQEEYLKMQMEIADAIKRQTEGIKSYGEAQKTLFENTKLRKQVELELESLRDRLEKHKQKQLELSDDELKSLMNYIVSSYQLSVRYIRSHRMSIKR